MSNDADGKIMSFMMVLILFLSAICFSVSWNAGERRGMIDECEKDLPRSERCVLVAVKEFKMEGSENK